jgi:hypothetical protein
MHKSCRCEKDATAEEAENREERLHPAVGFIERLARGAEGEEDSVT